MIAVGEQAPSFTMVNQDGETVSLKDYAGKFDFPYDLLSDGDKGASIQFGASDGSPGNASRVSVLIGPEGEIIRAYEKVIPADHPEQVLADLALV